jgi:peptide/nickel transport system substrate-binding protein
VTESGNGGGWSRRGISRRQARSWIRVGAAVATLGLIAAGCGGGKKTTAGTAEPSTTTSTVAATESTATTTPVSSEVPTAVSSGAVTTATVKGGQAATTTASKPMTTAAVNRTGVAPKSGISNVSAAPTTAPPSDVQPGGTLTFMQASGGNGDQNILKAANTGQTDAPTLFMLFDYLVYTDPATGQVVPQTAQSLTSTDGLVWTLKLKPNIKFTDDTPYDAAAVKFNIQRLQDPANAATRGAQAQLIKTMDVVDPVTLKMTLVAVNAVFPYSMGLIPFIGSPTAIQKQGNDDFVLNPVGAGPFVEQSNIPGSQKVLVRNPKYWNFPLPYVDKVIVKVVADESQRVNSYKAGEANVLTSSVATSKQAYDQAGAANAASVINGGEAFYMNTRQKPFSDPRARQAVTMAIDRADLIKVIDGGVLPAQNSMFHDHSPYYDSTIQQLPYDPTKAQQLFDALAADNGGPLAFDIGALSSTTGTHVAAAQYILGKLNTYRNVKVGQIQPMGSAAMTTTARGGKFSAVVYTGIWDDPDQGFTAEYDCNSILNYTGFCDTQVQNLIAEQRATLDANQRIADIKQMQKIINAAAPDWYFEPRTSWIFTSSNVQNVKLVNDGLFLFDRAWLKTR